MFRRAWFVALSVAGLCFLGYQCAWADTHLDVPTIRAALHTSTDEENGFIESVVQMATAGDLPADLVESTFLWARKKPKHRFQYFKRALIVRAAERGIQLQ